jgi:hypothetical protein
VPGPAADAGLLAPGPGLQLAAPIPSVPLQLPLLGKGGRLISAALRPEAGSEAFINPAAAGGTPEPAAGLLLLLEAEAALPSMARPAPAAAPAGLNATGEERAAERSAPAPLPVGPDCGLRAPSLCSMPPWMTPALVTCLPAGAPALTEALSAVRELAAKRPGSGRAPAAPGLPPGPAGGRSVGPGCGSCAPRLQEQEGHIRPWRASPEKPQEFKPPSSLAARSRRESKHRTRDHKYSA